MRRGDLCFPLVFLAVFKNSFNLKAIGFVGQQEQVGCFSGRDGSSVSKSHSFGGSVAGRDNGFFQRKSQLQGFTDNMVQMPIFAQHVRRNIIGGTWFRNSLA